MYSYVLELTILMLAYIGFIYYEATKYIINAKGIQSRGEAPPIIPPID